MKTVKLTLTQAEAQALADVLACIGGSEDLSRRGLTQGVEVQLLRQGIAWDPKATDLEGSLTFSRDSAAAPTAGGYTPCACRDCMEIAVSADVTTPDLCHECEAAGCEPGEECSAPGAYGAEDPAAGGAQ